MIVASEARVIGGWSGPKYIADGAGPILEHVSVGAGDGREMYDLVEENRDFLARTDPAFRYFTLADAIRARAVVSELAQMGSMYDYWILDNGTHVGNIELGINPRGKKPELGFWLIEEAQGKGLATRAARCLLEYGFSLPHVNEVTMWVKPDNTSSQLVAKRLGAEIRGQGQREWNERLVDFDIWEVSKDAF